MTLRSLILNASVNHIPFPCLTWSRELPMIRSSTRRRGHARAGQPKGFIVDGRTTTGQHQHQANASLLLVYYFEFLAV